MPPTHRFEVCGVDLARLHKLGFDMKSLEPPEGWQREINDERKDRDDNGVVYYVYYKKSKPVFRYWVEFTPYDGTYQGIEWLDKKSR